MTTKKKTEPAPSVIEAVRATETTDAVILVMNDIESEKVMSAWQRHKPKFTDRALRAGEDLDAAWEEVWIGCEYSLSNIADMAKLPLGIVVREIDRLKKAHILYPDGTIHKWAGAILNKTAQNYIQSLIRKI